VVWVVKSLSLAVELFRVTAVQLMAAQAETALTANKMATSMSKTTALSTPEAAVVAVVVKAVSVVLAAKVALVALAVLVEAVNTTPRHGKLGEATLVAVVVFHTARLLVALVDGVVAGPAITTRPTPVVDWLAVTQMVRATTRLAALIVTSTPAIATTAKKP
jgi:hypothetical protein